MLRRSALPGQSSVDGLATEARAESSAGESRGRGDPLGGMAARLATQTRHGGHDPRPRSAKLDRRVTTYLLSTLTAEAILHVARNPPPTFCQP